MLRPSTVSVVIAIAIAGCSKSSSEKKEVGSAAPPAGSAATPAGSGSGAGSEAPTEAATVVGPTRSATGALEVSGALKGTFEWKKKDQKKPISCAWSAEKEMGSVQVDVSDGAGKLLTLAIDVPPEDLGLPSLNVKSADLAEPLKTSLGFNVSGDDDGNITVKFSDTKVGEGDKQLTIKGTLDVTCPKKS